MKKSMVMVVALIASASLFSQQYEVASNSDYQVPSEPRTSLTVGVLQGGGSLVGVDFEALLGSRVGLQVGAGLLGYGAGINYHFKPSIRSSFMSVMYWHQGAGAAYTQSMIGPNYVFRGKRWFTAQLGLGFLLETGPGFPATMKQPDVILMYSIGAYFPL